MSNLISYEGVGAAFAGVEKLSSASTALALTYVQQDKLLVWQGQSSAARITLPAGEAGMKFNIFFHGDAASSATKILAQDSADFYLVDGSTARGVACESSAEGGLGITAIALDQYRWFADRFGASTLALATASS